MVVFLEDRPQPEGLQLSRGAPATAEQMFDANRDNMFTGESSIAKANSVRKAWENRLGDIEKVTGQKLDMPAYDGVFMPVWGGLSPEDMEKQQHRMIGQYIRFQDSIRDLGKQHPDYFDKWMLPIDWQAGKVARDAEKRVHDLDARNDSTWNSIAGFAGGFWGGMHDPINLGLAPFGAGKAVGQGALAIVKAGVVNGAINAAGEAVIQPFVQDWRKEAGMKHGLGLAAKNVGFAFAFGFALDAGVRSAWRGGKLLKGTYDGKASPEQMEAFGQGMDDWQKATPENHAEMTQRLEGIVDQLPARNPIRRAFESGDLEPLRKIDPELADGIERNMAILGKDVLNNDDAARGAAQYLDAEEGRPVPENINPADADAADIQATRSAMHPDEPPAIAPLPQRQGGQKLNDGAVEPLATTGRIDGKPYTSRLLKPDEVGTDARAFQFKDGGDADGVHSGLRDVGQWNPASSGKAFIFEKKDGSLVIADGHQRLGLAKRLAPQDDTIRIEAFVLKQADGWTPEAVRVQAAKKNIQEGSGSPLDYARILRESPDILDSSVPQNHTKMAQAKGLARLSDDAFGLVINEIVPQNHAALVGQHVGDTALHVDILRQMRTADLSSEQQARLFIGQALQSGTHEITQMTLMGLETQKLSLLGHRTKILADALRNIKQEQRLFATLEGKQADIEAAGNRLDAGANTASKDRAAVMGELVEKLATTHGPVSSALERAAARMAQDDMGITKARKLFLSEISEIYEKQGLEGLVNPPKRPMADEVIEPGSPEAEKQADLLGRHLVPQRNTDRDFLDDMIDLDEGFVDFMDSQSGLRLEQLLQTRLTPEQLAKIDNPQLRALAQDADDLADAVRLADEEGLLFPILARLSEIMPELENLKGLDDLLSRADIVAIEAHFGKVPETPALDIPPEFQAIVNRLPEDVRVEFVETVRSPEGAAQSSDAGTTAASWNRAEKLITISLHNADPAAKLRHEEVHALRDLGLLADDEWRLLLDEGHKAGIMDEKWGKTGLTRREAYELAYAKRSDLAEVMDQEVVAHLAERRKAGEDLGNTANTILDRILELLQKTANVLRGMGFRTKEEFQKFLSDEKIRAENKTRGMGFQTADDVFARIESGEIGRRKNNGRLGEGVSYSFGGVKSQLADHDALAGAKEMTSNGENRKKIWQETGWFKGADGKWRFEIDDSGSRFKDTTASTFGDAFHHESIFDHYPELGSLAFRKPKWRELLKIAGQYDPMKKEITSWTYGKEGRNTALHEMQHGIQDIEGFGRGAGYDELFDTITAMIEETLNGSYLKKIMSVKDMSIRDARKIMDKGLRVAINRAGLELGDMRGYNRVFGEIEARVVEHRSRLSVKQRTEKFPENSYDVPAGKSINIDDPDVLIEITNKYLANAWKVMEKNISKYPNRKPDIIKIKFTAEQVLDIRNFLSDMAGKHKYFLERVDDGGIELSKDFMWQSEVRQYLSKIDPKFNELFQKFKKAKNEKKKNLGLEVDYLGEDLLNDLIEASFFRKSDMAYSIDPAESAPVFYSNLTRGIEAVKQNKAPAQQWAGMISKMSGISKDELEWNGVLDWLKEQKGSVSKDDVAGYIRENEIVLRGASETIKPRIVKDVSSNLFGSKIEIVMEDGFRLHSHKRRFAGKTSYQVYDKDYSISTLIDNHPKTAKGKAEIEDHFVQLEILLNKNQFKENTQKGGTNYTETAIELASARGNDFDDQHFGPNNTVAHTRHKDRLTKQGEKLLYLEEVQSDWHEQGARKGYVSENNSDFSLQVMPAIKEFKEGLLKTVPQEGRQEILSILSDIKARDLPSANANISRFKVLNKEHVGIANVLDSIWEKARMNIAQEGMPDAPFKGDRWMEMSLKKMLRHAVDNSYEAISWNRGYQIADVSGGSFKNLPKSIAWKSDGKKITLDGVDKPMTLKEIEQGIGSKLSADIFAAIKKKKTSGKIKNTGNYRIPSEGFRLQYDQKMPRFLNKFTKKWGGKVEYEVLPDFKDTNTPNGVLRITDKMRESVRQGMAYSIDPPESPKAAPPDRLGGVKQELKDAQDGLDELDGKGDPVEGSNKGTDGSTENQTRGEERPKGETGNKTGGAERRQGETGNKQEAGKAEGLTGNNNAIRAELVEQKRRAVLTLVAAERIKQAALSHRNAKGQLDVIGGLVSHMEHHGTARHSSIALRERDILHTAQAHLAKLMIEFERGKVTGEIPAEKRRRLNDVVRASFGESVDDDLAKALAASWLGVSDSLRRQFNNAGGAIGKMENWGLPQSHNAEAIRLLKPEQWKARITPMLDREKMVNPVTGEKYDDAGLSAALDHVYETIITNGQNKREPSMQPQGKGALFRQHADPRFLHFKNADAWMAYAGEFGGLSGKGGEDVGFYAMMMHIKMMSRDIAAMEILGPNPEAMLTYMKGLAQEELKLSRLGQAAALPTDGTDARGNDFVRKGSSLPLLGRNLAHEDYVGKGLQKLDDYFAILRGTLDTPVDQGLANTGQSLRNWEVSTKLGSATLSAIGDVGTYKATLMFAGMKSDHLVLTQIFKYMQQGDREFALQSGLALDSAMAMIGEETRFGASVNMATKTGKLADRTLAWSGLTAWTQAAKHAFGMETMGNFARMRHQSFDKLHKNTRRLFNHYGITPEHWDLIRSHSPAVREGASFLRGMDMIEIIPSEANSANRARLRQAMPDLAGKERVKAESILASLDLKAQRMDALLEKMQQKGRYNGPDQAANLADLTSDIYTTKQKYMEMIHAETEYAVPSGTVGSQAITKKFRAGTAEGEAWRLFFQFKAYPISVLMMHGGRTMRLMHEEGTAAGAGYAAATMVAMTLTGGVFGTWLKDLKAGRDPDMDMTSKQFWGRAITQGGGLGIWGDMLFADHNRFGGSPLETLAGPFYSDVGKVGKLTIGAGQKLLGGKDSTVGKDALSLLRSNTPAIGSLWYTATAYNRILLDRMAGLVDPDAQKAFKRRMAKRERDYGQEHFWPLGQSMPARAPAFNSLGDSLTFK